ncbi:toxin-antitoxin system YwqK family antitoxin [bacterium]|nr:toxin-antitoxin system YwqK family antitoxin [bacterium]
MNQASNSSDLPDIEEDTSSAPSEKFVVSEVIERFEDGEPKKFYVYEDGVIKMMLDYWEPNVKKKMLEYNGHTKPHGVSIEWDENGQKLKEVNFRDGLRYGPSISWYPNGQMEYEEELRNDVLHGKKTKWYQNGNKEYEISFDYGTLHGKSTIYYNNGNKEESIDYDHGKINGKKMNYYENGIIKYECGYEDDVKNGLEIFYNEKGEKTWEVTWRMGDKINERSFQANIDITKPEEETE